MDQTTDEAGPDRDRDRLEAEVQRLRGLLEAERAACVAEMADGAEELRQRDEQLERQLALQADHRRQLERQRELVGRLRRRVRRLRRRATSNRATILELRTELDRHRTSRLARAVGRLDARVRAVRGRG